MGPVPRLAGIFWSDSEMPPRAKQQQKKAPTAAPRPASSRKTPGTGAASSPSGPDLSPVLAAIEEAIRRLDDIIARS